jgi:Uma2 family endonuclease
MRAVVLQPDPGWLAERRRLGLDARDEVWDGVLHVVPPASLPHQDIGGELYVVLRGVAASLGLKVFYESGVFDPTKGDADYRVPDLVVAAPTQLSTRGIEGRAELVIEILSSDDESRDKLPFYATCQVQEVWLVEPKTRVVEVYVLRGEPYFAVAAGSDGIVKAPRLALDLQTIAGKLRITWAGGSAEV